MNQNSSLPDPKDVSTDHLILPRPPSHEFRFRIRTLIGLTFLVASMFAIGRLLFLLTQP